VDKKLADHIRGQYFKTNQEMRSMQETFDALGGEEGISSMRQEVQDYANVLSQVAAGDPKAVEQVFADSVEGGKKLTMHAFDKLKSVDPAMHSALAMSAFGDILKGSGFPDGLNTLAAGIDGLLEDIARTDGQKDAYRTASNLKAWFDKFKAMGERPKDNQPDEREKSLAEKEKALNTEKENIWRNTFNENLNKELVAPAFKTQMDAFLKGRSLTPQQKAKIETDFYSALSQEFANDKKFAEKRDMLTGRRDEKGLKAIYSPRLGELVPKVFKGVRDQLGYGGAAGRPPAAAAATGPTFGKKPDASEVDWSKDRGRIRFMGKSNGKGQHVGEATLKNGKVVQFDWNAV